MPYAVEQRGSHWVVYNPESQRVYGTHGSQAAARAQQSALYANAPPDEEPAKAATWWPERKE